MFKAITFDYWQTLYADSLTNWKERQSIRVGECHKYLTSKGYSCQLGDVENGIENAYEMVMSRWHEHIGVSVETGMEKCAETLGLTLDNEEIASLIECLGNAFLASPPVIIPHVKQVVGRLSVDYPLGIISDSALTPGTYVRKLMERDNILDYFSAFTFSDESEHTKPKVQQYYSTLEQLNAEPADAVHIGDIVRTDIVGAKNAGMKAIRFSGINKSETDDILSDAVIDDYRQLEATIKELSK